MNQLLQKLDELNLSDSQLAASFVEFVILPVLIEQGEEVWADGLADHEKTELTKLSDKTPWEKVGSLLWVTMGLVASRGWISSPTGSLDFDITELGEGKLKAYINSHFSSAVSEVLLPELNYLR